jgi:protease YdgD
LLTRAIILKATLASFVMMAAAPSFGEQPPNAPSQPETNLVATDTHPWSAVGKLNNGLFGACTAVLISDDYALTSAHCLYFKFLRLFLPPESFHLVLGYDNQSLGKHLHVAAYHVPPTYDPRKPFESLDSDWALLQVTSDLKTEADPISIARKVDLTAQTEVMTAGYSSRRPHRMSADKNCRIIGSSADEKVLFDTCDTPEGFSGGPVLALNPDGRSFSVLGIHVANQAWQGKSVAIAISAATIWPQIRSCVEEHKCSFQHIAKQRDPTAAEIFAGLPNLGPRKVIGIVTDHICQAENLQCGAPDAGVHGLDGQNVAPIPTQRRAAPAAAQQAIEIGP